MGTRTAKYCQLCGQEYTADLEFCDKDGLALLAKGTSDPWLGRRLKNTYVIEELIGAGGMGRVYRAIQNPLQRSVAIKIIEPERDEKAMIKRFYREARLLCSIVHSNIVTVFDFGNTVDGVFFLVMEHLEGKLLRDVVPPGEGVGLPDAIRIFDQICAGVGAAHFVGMVHRDLKPNNIFIADQTGNSQVVKIMDFGLALVVGDGSTKLTRTGMLMGTPGYVAPELIGQSSSLAGLRSDIYAMGAILYFLLTGNEVYSKGSSQSILARQLMEKLDLEALSCREDLHPKLLELLITKSMSMEPDERHESCDALLEAFRYATAR